MLGDRRTRRKGGREGERERRWERRQRKEEGRQREGESKESKRNKIFENVSVMLLI